MQNLLSRPDTPHIAAITDALSAIARAFPVPKAHRRDLPFAVRDLSRILTSERGALSRSYWATPRLLSAYLHFFLPWNLYRLSWLLPTLPLDLRPGATILDLGCGPLTLPLALWCARPELRDLPLRFMCCDVASKPMELGRDILRSMAGSDSPWTVELVRAPLDSALARTTVELDAVFAGNVLNELPAPRHIPMEERMDALMSQVLRKLAPGGYFFSVEPGTRLGGKMIALARKGGLRGGFRALAPCPHQYPCPMLEQSWFYPPSPPVTGWCHFVHPAEGAPLALHSLGEEARLEKDSLALSCLLLQRPQDGELHTHLSDQSHGSVNYADDSLDALEELYAEMVQDDANDNHTRQKTPFPSAGKQDSLQEILSGKTDPRHPARTETRHKAQPSTARRKADSAHGMLRVISGMIRLPDAPEPGRYACCEKGLALLMDAVRVPSGAAVSVRWPAKEQRDLKTGALIVEWRPAALQNKAPIAPRGKKR